MKNSFDVGIIGGGVAGAFAALRLAEHHPNTKAILFELGRPPARRRRFLEAWFGCLPTGDGKIYTADVNKVIEIADSKKAKAMNKWIMNQFNEVTQSKVTKAKPPAVSVSKKIAAAGFEIDLHDYIQWYPDSIHQLSKIVADKIEEAGNVTFSFDNEVFSISKKNNSFVVVSAEGDFTCKKIILCAGRTGWRWVNKLYSDLGILVSDDYAKFGIKIEIPAQYMRDFKQSHLSLKRKDLMIGPISWDGSVIQEDHANLTVASFRSNEERWKTDKVFFSMIGLRPFEGQGCNQTDRLAGLAFILFGDRVGREKIKNIIKGQSQLNLIPEYQWMVNSIKEINEIIPALITRGYYHSPDIYPITSEIRLSSHLESEIDGLYIAGESAGVIGIAAAGITGAIAAESCAK